MKLSLSFGLSRSHALGDSPAFFKSSLRWTARSITHILTFLCKGEEGAAGSRGRSGERGEPVSDHVVFFYFYATIAELGGEGLMVLNISSG